METVMAWDGITGHLFEEEVLGRCRVRHNGYLRWREAATLARASQPTCQTATVALLERIVSKKIGAAVRCFTAIGTPLDYFHGVDGFFEFHGTVVTIDVTHNPHKDTGKADLIVHPDDLGDLSELAARVAREFATKLSRGARC